MQAFQSSIRMFGLLLLLIVACQPRTTGPLYPTPIVGNANSLQSTPTLTSGNGLGAVSSSVDPSGTYATADRYSLGDPYIPELGNGGYDVQNYVLAFALNPKVSSVIGRATIEIIAARDGLADIALDFVGFDITQIEVNGMPVTYSREGKKLLVVLPQPVLAGTRLAIVVSYQGEPTREKSPYVGFTDGLGLNFVEDQSIYALSEPDGARYWFPANDHPRDKALFRFEITVPIGLTAVANGRLIDIKQGELETLSGGGTGRTYVWEHNFPMATYLALVAVGPFQRFEGVSPNGVSLRHYATAPYRQELETAVSSIGEAVDWMSDLFGAYPFEAFGYVAAEMPPTAMETQTIVIVSNELIGKRTAVHELSHMWFGNWVSLDSWSEMWRKEGFATYVTLMWETEDVPALLDQKMEEMLAAVGQNTPRYAIGYPPPEHLLGYNTYFKGAVFIHTLRREMGDEAFFNGVRSYLTQYGGRTASDEQFQSAMEASAGRSLQALFDEWLN